MMNAIKEKSNIQIQEHGILAENDKQKYKCEQAKECENAVAGKDFETVDWTTNIVYGMDAPRLNNYPIMNACLSVNPKKLAVIASCLCSNPTSKTLQDLPDMPQVFESS